MSGIAVLVDDLATAQVTIAALLARPAPPTLCVLVLCAPKLTHRIGPWATHRSRERWREHGGANLRQGLEPMFSPASGLELEWIIARAPLPRLTQQLRLRLGAGLEVLDARRQKFDPPDAGLATDTQGRHLVSLTALSAGMTLRMALAD
jgi:hypothetical protein